MTSGAASPELVSLMIRIGDALGTAVRPSTVSEQLTKATAGVRSLFSAAACSCALVTEDGENLTFVAADGKGAKKIVGVQMPLQRGIAGWVVMSGQSIVVSDVDQDARFARDIAESTEFIPKSIMAVPLIDAAGEISGVIEVLDPRTGSEHTGRDLEILGVISAQIASVVELGRVYDRMGAALIAGLSGSEDSAAFGATLAELAAAGGADAEFAELAATFNELAAVGPAGLRMAQTVLREVIVFTRSRR